MLATAEESSISIFNIRKQRTKLISGHLMCMMYICDCCLHAFGFMFHSHDLIHWKTTYQLGKKISE